jgi:hypothetical protein
MMTRDVLDTNIRARTIMVSAQAAGRSKRRMKPIPALGAAGLSLSLVGGATSAIGSADLHRTTILPPAAQQALAEEEIFDVSLATFHVRDDGTVARTADPRPIIVGQGACGADLYYPQGSSAASAPVYQASPPARPVYRYKRSYRSGRR